MLSPFPKPANASGSKREQQLQALHLTNESGEHRHLFPRFVAQLLVKLFGAGDAFANASWKRRILPGARKEVHWRPLWVKSRHMQRTSSCPLYPRKRTFAVDQLMSAKGQ
jgi:hypothetical protein